jgi:transcription elongation factor Elf1
MEYAHRKGKTMDQLELKYINLVGGRLRNFHQKSLSLYNFSCPMCGDSKTKKTRARGYIYEKEGKLLYHCHNCNITMGVSRFIKEIDPQ